MNLFDFFVSPRMKGETKPSSSVVVEKLSLTAKASADTGIKNVRFISRSPNGRKEPRELEKD